MHRIAVEGGDPTEVWKVWTVRGCGDSCCVSPTAGDVVYCIAIKSSDPASGWGGGAVWPRFPIKPLPQVNTPPH